MHMYYKNRPTKPLKEFTRDLLRANSIILCSNGFIADSNVYRAFFNAGYGNVTVQDLEKILEEISKDYTV